MYFSKRRTDCQLWSKYIYGMLSQAKNFCCDNLCISQCLFGKNLYRWEAF